MSKYYLKRIPHSIVFALTLEDLYNNHKFNFDGMNIGAGKTRHTSLDWFLAPTERPSIEKASVKEHYIDIPGTNGGLDLSEALTGFPLYDYIEGSFEFNVLNERKLPILNDIGEKIGEKEVSWEVLNRDIREFLNGRERYMMLEDDPAWYYKGRFTIGAYDASNASNSRIKIEYKVYPYKRLSTCIYNTKPLNVYFDTISLMKDDVAQAVVSFWGKTDVSLNYEETHTYDGRREQFDERALPCGSESVPIKIIVDCPVEGYIFVVDYGGPPGEEAFKREYILKEGKQEIKLRGLVLRNVSNRGLLYSGCWFKLSLMSIYDDFDETVAYSKGDKITLNTSQIGSSNWILVAKEDIASGSSFDISKWELDSLGLIGMSEFSETESYSVDDIVYRYDTTNNTVVAYKALGAVSPGTFNPSDWTDNFYIRPFNVYSTITFSMLYDIGVM